MPYNLSGPRVNIDTEIDPVNLPEDLDRYRVESESGFDDILSPDPTQAIGVIIENFILGS